MNEWGEALQKQLQALVDKNYDVGGITTAANAVVKKRASVNVQDISGRIQRMQTHIQRLIAENIDLRRQKEQTGSDGPAPCRSLDEVIQAQQEIIISLSEAFTADLGNVESINTVISTLEANLSSAQ